MQTADLNSLRVCVVCFQPLEKWALLLVLIHASLEIRGAGPVQPVLLVGRRPSKRPVWENPEIKSEYPISWMKTDRPVVARFVCQSLSTMCVYQAGLLFG